MPRLLLISLHFPPLDVIASERARAMALFLQAPGWHVDVLTHHWHRREIGWDPGGETEYSEEVIGERGRIIRIGAGSRYRTREARYRGFLVRKLRIAWDWFSGWLDPQAIVRDCHDSMEHWLKGRDLSSEYDLLIGIYSPHAHLRLLSGLGRRTGLPVHMDFRDLWDNALAAGKYRPNGIMRIKGWCISAHWRNWMKGIDAISSVSEPLTLYLRQKYNKPGIAICTGFDIRRFHPNPDGQKEYFSIVHAGTLYNHQRIEILLEGLRRFLVNHPGEPIRVHFPGADRPGNTRGDSSYLPEAARFVRDFLKDPRVEAGRRIPGDEARKMMTAASVLLKPVFPGDKGVIGGKLYEYMGARRPILCAPRDHGSIDHIVLSCGLGLLADTSDEVFLALENWYSEWKENGSTQPAIIEGEWEKFRSEHQMEQLGRWLLKMQPTKEKLTSRFDGKP